MSFSSDAREELCRALPQSPCCGRAQLAALLRFCSTLRLTRHGPLIRFDTDSAAVARHLFRLIKAQSGQKPALMAIADPRLGKAHRYSLESGAQAARSMLAQSDMLDARGVVRLGALPAALLRRRCCKRAYLQGVFLAAGTVVNPHHAYHAELQTRDFELAAALCDLLEKLSIPARVHPRREQFVVYIKQAEDVVSLLRNVGAHQALLAYENVRAAKQLMGATNRAVNCDTANTNKQLAAAARQIGAIQRIQASGGFPGLSPPLREMAQARLDRPDAGLDELAEFLGVSKSGANHRLRKLMQLGGTLQGNP